MQMNWVGYYYLCPEKIVTANSTSITGRGRNYDCLSILLGCAKLEDDEIRRVTHDGRILDKFGINDLDEEMKEYRFSTFETSETLGSFVSLLLQLTKNFKYFST